MHLVVEGRGLPLTVLIIADNVDDSVVFEQAMTQGPAAPPGGWHPRTTPLLPWGDKGYPG